MSNCTYKVKIKDIQNNYKVIMEDIQNKYKFKIFCTGNSYDDTEIREEIEALQDELDEAEEELEQYKTIYNALPKVTGEGTNINLNNTANAIMKFKEYKGNTYQANTILPSEYTQVDYIESSGTQYIDTGFIPNQDSSIEIEYKKKTDTIIFGSRESLNARTFTLALLGENKIRSDYGTENINITVSSTYIQTIFKREKNKVYINNAEVATHGIQTFTCPSNLYLFGANNNGNVVYGSHNIYYCKIYDNDILIRDFIPCYRNSDNEIGLYDLVNNVFYTNQGTGTFTYGAVVSIPNPDYPQNIEVVTGNQNVEVCGKNLFDKNSIENDKWLLQDGTTQNNANWCITNYISIKPNTNYYLPTPDSRRLKYYDKNKQPLTTNDWDLSNGSINQTITTPNNAYYVRFTIHYTVIDINEYQFEQGSTATTYEQYQSQSYPVNLGDMELCKINTYQDRIYKQNDKWYLEKQTNKISLNGDENWEYASGSTNPYRYFVRSIMTDRASGNNVMIANYFKQVNNTSSVGIYNGQNVNFGIKNVSTINNFKFWLSTHNTIVYYALATPTTTEITDTPLIEQLETISKQLAYKGQTNIIVSGNLPVIINVETLKDLSVEETPVASVNRLQSIRPTIIQPEINNIEEQPEEIEEEIPEQE